MRVAALEDADLDTRLTALENPPFLVATLTGSGLSDSNKLTPASELAEGSWSIASNDIQVPKAGWYSVSVHAVLTSTNTGNPYSGGIVVAQAGSGGVAFFRGKRWTATAGTTSRCREPAW